MLPKAPPLRIYRSNWHCLTFHGVNRGGGGQGMKMVYTRRKAPQGHAPSFTQRAPFHPELNKPHFQTAGQTSLSVLLCVCLSGFRNTEILHLADLAVQALPGMTTVTHKSGGVSLAQDIQNPHHHLLPCFPTCCQKMPQCVASAAPKP